MPSIQHHQQNEPLKLKMRGFTKNRYLYPILSAFAAKLGIEISIDGGDILQTPKGVHVKVTGGDGGDGDSPHNFYISLATVGEDLKASVADGTINDVTPELASTAIDTIPAPSVTVSATGTVKGWFKVYITPTVENQGTEDDPLYRITGGTVTGVDIVFDASAPTGVTATVNSDTGDVVDGTYVRRIGTIVDGVVVRPQPAKFSYSVLLCDGGPVSIETPLIRGGILTFGVGL